MLLLSALGERHLIEHGVSVYQDQVHVPLLIHHPGQSRGTVVGEDVSSVDLLPAVLDVAGLPNPTGLLGRSLIHPAAVRGRAVFTESYPNGYRVRYGTRFRRVVRDLLKEDGSAPLLGARLACSGPGSRNGSRRRSRRPTRPRWVPG